MNQFRSSFALFLTMSFQIATAEPPPPAQAYRAMCDRTLQAVLTTSAGTNIVDVFPVYLSGWIQATNAVPTLLKILEKPRGTNDVGSLGGYYHPLAVSTPRPPTPPTPAAGALSIGPISLGTLTNELCQTDIGSHRADLLLWVAMAKYGEEFGQIVADGAAMGNPLWTWANERGALFRPFPRPFQFRAFAFRFPKTDMEEYLRIFRELRSVAEAAEAAGNEELFQQAKDALQEIGHPYDEVPSLWPK